MFVFALLREIGCYSWPAVGDAALPLLLFPRYPVSPSVFFLRCFPVWWMTIGELRGIGSEDLEYFILGQSCPSFHLLYTHSTNLGH